MSSGILARTFSAVSQWNLKPCFLSARSACSAPFSRSARVSSRRLMDSRTAAYSCGCVFLTESTMKML